MRCTSEVTERYSLKTKQPGRGWSWHLEEHVNALSCILSTNAKQGPAILIVFLLINTTDNRQGELQRPWRKSINIQYVVVLVKIMGRLWRGGSRGKCIVLLVVAWVNCKSEHFKAAQKFMQSDKLHKVLNSTLPVNCVSG